MPATDEPEFREEWILATPANAKHGPGFPHDPELGQLWTLAAERQSRREYASAEPLWRTLVDRDPTNGNLLLNLAIALLHQGKTDEAQCLCEDLTRAHKDWGMPHHVLAHVLKAKGASSDALHSATRAVALQPNAYTRTGLGEVHEDLGNFNKAVKEYERAWRKCENQPEQDMVRVAWGRALCWLGAYRKAVRILEPLLGSDSPHEADASWALGGAYFEIWQAGDRQSNDLLLKAKRAFDRTIQLAPSEPKGWTGTGLIQFKLGDPASAIGFLDKALELEDNVALVQHWRACALHSLERYEEAIAAARASNSADDTEPLSNYKVMALSVMSDPLSHRDLIEELEGYVDQSPEIANVIASLLWQRREEERAGTHYRSALERWPGDSVLLQNSMNLAIRSCDLNWARDCLQRLQADHPEVVARWDAVLLDAVRRRAPSEMESRIAWLDQRGLLFHANPAQRIEEPQLLDHLIELQSVRFEERVGQRYQQADRRVQTGARPTFLEGKEIDVLVKGNIEIILVSCKLRKDPQKLIARGEVWSLSTKLDLARQNLDDRRSISAELVSNAINADSDAWDLAKQEGIALLHASLPKNWKRSPRWDVLRIDPMPMDEIPS